MLDDAKKLPSFSNETQKFGPMTLFNGPKGLTLHVPSDLQFSESVGHSLREMAHYYLNYKEIKSKNYEEIGIATINAAHQYSKRQGFPPAVLTPDELRESISKIAIDHARLDALNCGDPCDLSEEFCAAAKDLGVALNQRLDAGVTSIVLIHAGGPAEKFMKPQHG